jgi:hypothetical protein
MLTEADAVSEAMCREDSGANPHCINCKEPVERVNRGGPALQNYRVGPDGLCRHINCRDLNAFEHRSYHSR